jgi:hypothetical protein
VTTSATPARRSLDLRTGDRVAEATAALAGDLAHTRCGGGGRSIVVAHVRGGGDLGDLPARVDACPRLRTFALGGNALVVYAPSGILGDER